MKDRIIRQLVQHSRLIMLGNLLLVAVLAFGASHLQLESGIRIFFSEQDPNLLAQDALERRYGKPDNILVVVDARGQTLFTRDHLATLEQLTQRAWQTPYSRRVDSITNFQHPSVDGDDIVIEELVEGADARSDAELARIRDIALHERALVGRLIAPDGTAAAINITLNLPQENEAAAVAEAVTFVREAVAAVRPTAAGLDIYLAGLAVTDQSLAEVTAADAATLMPMLLFVVLLLLALLLRSVGAALLTLVIVALAVAAGMGFAGWAGIAINSVNISAPTIIMTLAVADCVHLLSVFLRKLRAGCDKAQALEDSLGITAYPIVLTSLTTALGFLSMNLSESPPFRDLGNISAAGVLAALWITLAMLPGLIMFTRFRRSAAAPRLRLSWLAELVIRHRDVTFYGSLTIVFVLVACISRIELNDDPAGYFSSEIPLTRAIEVIEERLSGTQSIAYDLDSGVPNGVLEPQFLQYVDDFAQWLRRQPEVVNVTLYTDVLKRLNQVMHADDPAWHRLPDNRPLAAQYSLLYEMSVPYGLDITNQVSADKSALKLTATLHNQKSRGLLAFEQRAAQWLAANAPTLDTRGAGQSISFAHIGLRNIRSMLTSSLLAIVLVSACLAVAFRSLRLGLISLLPNLLPALTALGIWGIFVGEVNIAASVVFSLTLGIIVDDTIHFLVKYLAHRERPDSTPEQAVRYAFEQVGSALVTTSIVLAAGFLILVQSDFSVNSTTGLLVATTIGVAIVLDLTLLPGTLLKVDRWLVPRRYSTPAQPQTEEHSA